MRKSTIKTPAARQSSPDYRRATARVQHRRQLATISDVTEMDLSRLVRRLVIKAANAPMVVSPGLAIRIEEKPSNSFAFNPPYGILPTLLSASPEELIEAADKFSVAKYEFQRRGDYYRAWQSAWRQRLCEQVLQNITSIGIVTV